MRMKTTRIAACTFVCVALMALVACSSNAATTSSQASSSSDSAASASAAPGSASGGEAQMANPWSDSEDAAQTAKGAGIDGFTVPDVVQLSVGDVAVQQFRFMEGIAEADASLIESDGATVDARIIVRKGALVDGGDISGDYNEYAHQWTQSIDEVNLTCFGAQESMARKVIWSNGDYLFSIVIDPHQADELPGLDPSDTETLVKAIQ